MKHTHKWQFLKKGPHKSYKEICSCGAIRRVKRISRGLKQITYLPSGRRRVIR